jgi:hypothetical protein
MKIIATKINNNADFMIANCIMCMPLIKQEMQAIFPCDPASRCLQKKVIAASVLSVHG